MILYFLIILKYISTRLDNNVFDIFTVNTGCVLNHIDKIHNLFKNKTISIISTLLEYGTKNYYNIQAKGVIKQDVALNKLTSRNTNAALVIEGRIYDIKHTTLTSTNQNHIYPRIYEWIQNNLECHFDSLLDNLNNRPETKMCNSFMSTLTEIINQKDKTISEKNEMWNKYLLDNFKLIPKEYTIPLIMQTTDILHQIIISKYLLEKAHISPEVLEKKTATIKEITDITAVLGLKYNQNANKLSDGIIPLVTTDDPK